MIDRGHDLRLGRQVELLGRSRSTLYYEPRPVPAVELVIMRRMDELHLDCHIRFQGFRRQNPIRFLFTG
jgi:putative transposase